MSSFWQDPSQGDMGMKTIREGREGEGMKKNLNEFTQYTTITIISKKNAALNVNSF